MYNITFQEESFSDVIKDIKPLLEKHWEEIALNKDKINLNPDYEKYEELSDMGLIRIFTARDEAELVGYFAVTVTPNLHYKDHKYAINDVIYLEQNLRGLGVGKRLISFAEDGLKEAGVSVLVVNTKVHQPFDILMEKLDYTLQERVYSKYIGDN